MSSSASLIAGLAISVALAVVHWNADLIDRLRGVRPKTISSFAGGISVAYVFLHLLPELAEGNIGIAEALGEQITITPLVDLGIFLVALAGFTTFYGLDLLARSPGTDTSSSSRFWVHLGAFCVYNATITYTMPLRLRTGVAFAALFSVAMALHFVLTDRQLREHYPDHFRGQGRALLAAALLVGWLLAAVASPTRTLVVSLLTAFLGGSILLNVFREELPSGRGSKFGAFLSGLVSYSVVLAGVTSLAE